MKMTHKFKKHKRGKRTQGRGDGEHDRGRRVQLVRVENHTHRVHHQKARVDQAGDYLPSAILQKHDEDERRDDSDATGRRYHTLKNLAALGFLVDNVVLFRGLLAVRHGERKLHADGPNEQNREAEVGLRAHAF